MSEKRSWLDGPQVPGEHEYSADLSKYPGQTFGLPQSGPGSLATLMPRMAALLIDWLLCFGMAFFVTRTTTALGDTSTVTLLLFVALRVITVWLFAQSPGHSLVGLGVGRLDQPDARVGFVRALARTILTVFLLPPIVQDTDGRGMHDRATGTAVIRTR